MKKLGIALALAALFVLVPARPAAAVNATVPAHQFNMKGPGNSGPDFIGVADFIGNNVSAAFNGGVGPWIVTMNEVCFNQYAHLVNNWGMNPSFLGFSHYFTTTRTGVAGCGSNSNFGNALFTLGTPTGGAFFEHTLSPQDGSPEVRKLSCNTSTVFIYVYIACVAHFDNSGIAAQQNTNAYTTIEAFYGPSGLFGHQARFIGGDFNVQFAGHWGSTHWEHDYSLWRNTYNPSSVKIDYIYGDAAHAFQAPIQSAPQSTGFSDHRYLRGVFYF